MYSVKNRNYTSPYKYGESYGAERKEEEEPLREETEQAAEAERKEKEKARLISEMKEKQEEEKAEDTQDPLSRMKSEAQAIKDCFDKKKQKNLYDATADLMAIANAEKEASLRTIHTRLLFKARMLRASGASSGEIKVALAKIKKVIGKVKAKIKNLRKEEEIEKKRDRAEKAKQRKMEEELRRELELRREVRKKREKKDVEESRMGMGANYGGPAGSDGVSVQSAGGGVITSISSTGAALADESLMSDAALVGAEAMPVSDAAAVAGDVGAAAVDVML